MSFEDKIDVVRKKKVWFAQFRYPTPDSLEYFLEENAAEGYSLNPIGETGMFYYEFTEAKSGKCKFLVDRSGLSKAFYVETMINEEWELMGQSLNCYIWRKYYDGERPADMNDKVCLTKHGRNTFIGFLIAALFCLAAVAGLGIGTYIERKVNGKFFVHHYLYMAEALVILLLGLYFIKTSIKCFKYWRKMKKGY